ncbi:hypothetical protein [Ruminococcus sp.]|uniref:hypothetical protein n=1 Tax=Ruminococcus sp. TaxID=41978 RepID=UPI001B3F4400|nr:hypothetical protein [Ruminococcus sp.]MBP5431007.1 hypothetical protein [Ruminococcus sp.]
MRDAEKELRDFFNRMPCIVDMNSFARGRPIINAIDRIVQVERDKCSDSHFTVYYYHRIYSDDRIYKCKARFKVLPDIVKTYISERFPKETAYCVKWNDLCEKNTQLSFFEQ